MERIKVEPAFTDERGVITDLLNGVELRHIGLLKSKAGSVRGNHYHKLAAQYTYVVSGKLEFAAQEPGEAVETTVLSPGDLMLTGPNCAHAMRFLEDSEIMTFTTRARDDGGYEDDTIRLEQPLIPLS